MLLLLALVLFNWHSLDFDASLLHSNVPHSNIDQYMPTHVHTHKPVQLLDFFITCTCMLKVHLVIITARIITFLYKYSLSLQLPLFLILSMSFHGQIWLKFCCVRQIHLSSSVSVADSGGADASECQY